MSPGVEHPTIFRIVEGRHRHRDDEPGAHRPIRLRLDRSLGPEHRRRVHPGRRQRRASVPQSGAAPGESTSPRRPSSRSVKVNAAASRSRGTRRSTTRRRPLDAPAARRATERYWAEWMQRCTYQGEWRDDVVRSLITVKALQYAPDWRGVRGRDHLAARAAGRGPQLGLPILLAARLVAHPPGPAAVAATPTKPLRGNVGCNGRSPAIPGDFQIMYGVGGERRLTEVELDWLPGYENSKPVRIGNEASEQFQLDVFGEIADAALTGVEAALGARASPSRASPAGGRAAAGDDGAPRKGLAAPRRRHLGDPRPATPLHPVEGDGLGRVRPGREDRREDSAAPISRSTGGASSPTR